MLLLTFEVDSQASSDEQKRDSVEKHLDEPEAKPPSGHVVAAGHVSNDLKKASSE